MKAEKYYSQMKVMYFSGLIDNSFLSGLLVYTFLDEEKNGYVARDQLLYAIKLSAGLMPGVPDKPSARGPMGTRTNQGSRINYITEKPYLHHQLGVPRAPMFCLLAAAFS